MRKWTMRTDVIAILNKREEYERLKDEFIEMCKYQYNTLTPNEKGFRNWLELAIVDEMLVKEIYLTCTGKEY